jgi:hypothetical protein
MQRVARGQSLPLWRAHHCSAVPHVALSAGRAGDAVQYCMPILNECEGVNN